jgi:hypothetical protein
MKTKRKKKSEKKTYYLVKSEYGLDFKRWFTSVHKTKEIAEAYKRYLDLKDPYDKHYLVEVVEK